MDSILGFIWQLSNTYNNNNNNNTNNNAEFMYFPPKHDVEVL